MNHLSMDDPLASVVAGAIRTGDVARLHQLLTDHPELATATIVESSPRGAGRSLLHVATDWPGHYPNGPEIVAVLVAAGADVNAKFVGAHAETPLHWAASSNDTAVLDALLDAGAEIDAPGGVIGGGSPLSDAVAFAQWSAARRLVERGAKVRLAEAAALGLLDVVQGQVETASSDQRISHAFWYACHAGQRSTAEYLLDRGAELDWLPPWEKLTPLDAAVRNGFAAFADWLRSRGARSATSVA